MQTNKVILFNNIYKKSFKGQNKTTDNPKVSIVLPIYNQERYLGKAIDSLRNQTLEEIEFICINDGSKDKTLEILNNYANKDNRVKIIDQPNQGAGRARNNGIKQAKGEYIAFLDPDDWFEKDALQKLYEKSVQRKCDMLVFNFNKIDENTGIISRPYNIGERIKECYPEFQEEKNFSWHNIKSAVFRGLLWMTWNKIYNHDFVNRNRLHFGDCSLAEDNIFMFDATLKAKNIGYINDYLYNYLQHEGSALHKKSDKNFCIFKAIDGVKSTLKKLGLTEQLQREFDNYILKLLTVHSSQIVSQDKLKEICRKKLSAKQLAMLEKNGVL